MFGMIKNIVKARLMGRLLTRGIGGSLGSTLMMAYFGKKAYDHYQRSRRARLVH
jgi:hypothetical protein